MKMLAEDERTIFVGQGVRYNCHRMWETLADVPMEKRVEFPVAEEMQLGYCIGLALEGHVPICIYPRIDFMLLAMNQLVNHLDKAHMWGWTPKVIIRTAVGSTKPLDPGPQHSQDHTDTFKKILSHVAVRECESGGPEAVYKNALYNLIHYPSLIIERMEHY